MKSNLSSREIIEKAIKKTWEEADRPESMALYLKVKKEADSTACTIFTASIGKIGFESKIASSGGYGMFDKIFPDLIQYIAKKDTLHGLKVNEDYYENSNHYVFTA